MSYEEEFRTKCRRHDLTYNYSDDHRYWVNGQKTLGELVEFAKKHLTRKKAVEIWNSVVDEKLKPEFAKSFYWKEND